MTELSKRPLALISASFYISLCLLAEAEFYVRLVFGAVFVSMICVFCILKCSRDTRKVIILLSSAAVFAAILSVISIDLIYGNTARRYTYESGEHRISAQVTDIGGTTAYSAYYTSHITEVDGEPANFDAVVLISGELLNCGDRFEATVSFSEFEENASGFPEKRYYLADRIFLFAEADALSSVTPDGASGVKAYFQGLNSRLSGILSAMLGRREGGFAAAVFLGNRDMLEPSIRSDFTSLGISHLLAISGIHLSVITFAIAELLKRLRVPRKLGATAIILLTLIYTALTGFSGSVMRAGLMLTISNAAMLFDREGDSITSLTFASAIICLTDPFYAFDIGLQLSFTAMLACISAQSMIRRLKARGNSSPRPTPLKKLGDYIIFSLTVSCAAILFTLPLSAAYFGSFSPIAPLSNLLFVPIVSLSLYLIPPVLITYPLGELGELCAAILKPILSQLLSLAETAARLLPEPVSLRFPFAVFLTAAITASAVFAVISSRKIRRRALALTLSFVILFTADIGICHALSSNRASITAFTRKKSDALLVVNENRVLVCDISDGSYSAVKKAIYEAECAQSIGLDVYMLTHYHRRHIAQIEKIAESHGIGELWLPEAESESDASVLEAITEFADQNGIEVTLYGRGEESALEFASCRIDVGPLLMLGRSTHPIITLTVSAYGKTAAYMGASSGEAMSAADTAGRADAVFFGIHGPIFKSEFYYSFSDSPELIFLGNSVNFADSEMLYENKSGVKASADTASVIFKKQK